MVEESFDPHSHLINEAENADNLFNITAGCVRLYKLLGDGRRQITGFLFPGDFLGLAVDETYGYSAEAITKVEACRFPRRRFEGLLDDIPKLERRLLGLASNELAAAQDQMLLLGRKTAQEKVASFLLTLSHRARQAGRTDNPVELPMSRSDIADYLGLTTETVSRTFTQMKRTGAIRLMEGSRVAIPDPDVLEDISNAL